MMNLMSEEKHRFSFKLKRLLKGIFKLFLVFFFVLLLFEMIYRFQWIDFYKNEWQYQNRELKVNDERDRVLVFGDSFTADPMSWLNKCRADTSYNYKLYNAALPGVGIETFRLIQSIRQEEVHPKKIIIQLYVGNDLYDIRKPVRWTKFSLARNLFWTMSNRFRSLNFINYRMGQVSQDVESGFDPKKDEIFNQKRYSARTKLFISGNADYLNDAIELSESVQDEFDKLLGMLHEMKDSRPEKTTFYVLVIPHCSQVHERYLENYRSMGATMEMKMLRLNEWTKRLKKENLKVIDPLPYFREIESNGSHLYYENDPHLNEIGQTRLAEFVTKRLVNF